MRKKSLRLFVLALCLAVFAVAGVFFPCSQGCAANRGFSSAGQAPPPSQVLLNPNTYKATWLNDPLVGMPFCRVVSPGDWDVAGRPVWNARFASKPWTACIIMTNPRRRMARLSVLPYAELRWREAQAGRYSATLPDGSFDTDTGILVRRYRSAGTVLSEFIAPALKNVIPGLRTSPPRPLQTELESLRSLMQQRAAILKQSGNRVTGMDAGRAEMRLEWVEPDGVAMEGKVEVGVYGVSFVTAYTSTTLWSISSMEMFSWRKDDRGAENMYSSASNLFKLEFNPQWIQTANQISAGIQQKSGNVLTQIHTMSRRSFREAQEVRYKLDDSFRRALSSESVYQAPDGSTYLAPNTTNYAYVNSVTGETFATGREVPSGALPFGFDPMKLIEP